MRRGLFICVPGLSVVIAITQCYYSRRCRASCALYFRCTRGNRLRAGLKFKQRRCRETLLQESRYTGVNNATRLLMHFMLHHHMWHFTLFRQSFSSLLFAEHSRYSDWGSNSTKKQDKIQRKGTGKNISNIENGIRTAGNFDLIR